MLVVIVYVIRVDTHAAGFILFIPNGFPKKDIFVCQIVMVKNIIVVLNHRPVFCFAGKVPEIPELPGLPLPILNPAYGVLGAVEHEIMDGAAIRFAVIDVDNADERRGTPLRDIGKHLKKLLVGHGKTR